MSKFKILLVDDNVKFIKNISRYFKLTAPDYEVYTTGTGEDGLKILEAEKPDILICDLFMLDIDGDEVIQKAKVISPHTSLIILTAYADDSIYDKLKRIGADEVIFKPIEDMDIFISKIKTILNKKSKIKDKE